MEIAESTKIYGLKIVTPYVFHDFRGEYVETFSTQRYEFYNRQGKRIEFVEDDISVSRQNVLRGLHGDNRTWKFIQCLYGELYFVVVDMRKDSPTYLNWESFAVNDRNRKQILVPAGCANGHLCLSEKCIFSYKQSQYYDGSEKQFTVRWDDPKLNIYWPIRNPILSNRDSSVHFL
jgi:dTDP-4-dehydrorhamnose 3,5-epimerase